MENKFRQGKEEQVADVPSAEKKSLFNFFKKLDPSEYLTKEYAVELLPYIFFLAVLGIVYISNSYYAEGTIKKIEKVNNELKELRSEYITSKSDLMFKSKQSEVAKAVEGLEIKESVVPPKIIVIKKDSVN